MGSRIFANFAIFEFFSTFNAQFLSYEISYGDQNGDYVRTPISRATIVNLTAAGLSMREGGVLKLAYLYMFLRRRTNGTLAAPPVNEIYRPQ